MRWDVNFNPRLDDLSSVYHLFIEIEAFKKSVLKLPIPPALSRKVNKINIVRQIKGTTGIEGNTLSEEVISGMINITKEKEKVNNDCNPTPKVNNEEQEVKNAYAVIEFIRKYDGHKQLITEELIKELHYINTCNCNYAENIPGQYRRHQNQAGTYIPPSPENIPNLMKQFVSLMNENRTIKGYSPLIRAIMAHFYLVSIHPFGDGNGRTSRALEAFILYHAGYNVRGFYSLANYYYKNRQRYIDELQKARFEYQGGLLSFIKFSLEGFIEELDSVQDEILDFYTRLGFENYLSELLQNEEINARIYNLLRFMTQTKNEFSLNDFRTKRHPLLASIYQKIKSEKTISRDIKTMLAKDVAILEDSKLKVNISIMQQFLE